ncbi:MAG: hypothetical protein MMC33_002205 [Icmadophila ericetorum]|nr:hypothetical protein [Icmadophila ericetorum]
MAVITKPEKINDEQSPLIKKHLDESQTENRYTLSYSLRTLWLLTYSDLDTFCIPQTSFGIFGALSGPILTSNTAPDLLVILSRLPKAFLWVLLNTIVFDLANQRLPESVKEDSVNKPWRPLAAGRLNTHSATQLLLLATPLTFLATWFYLGGVEEATLLFTFTWMYNDLGGSDNNVAVRNILIAGMYVLYSSGAMRVACGFHEFTLNPVAYQWLGIIAAVIFTTMHVQDLKDEAGDRTRGRKTLPIVVGHLGARWVIASLVTFWSAAAPMFWNLGIYGFIPSGILAILVAYRVLVLRGKKADRRTWKLWSLWLTSLYFLPLFKDYSVFGRAVEKVAHFAEF